jgi:hypothetical protein
MKRVLDTLLVGTTVMLKNLAVCPHCVEKGKEKSARPATPHRSPLVSRSNGKTFHVYLEESFIRPDSTHSGSEVVALFRYDLDSAGVNGESTLVVIPLASGEAGAGLSELERTADELAEILGSGKSLPRQYVLRSQARA